VYLEDHKQSEPLLWLHLQWHAGTNTELGKDYTLFSTVDGIVVFEKKRDQPRVSWESHLVCAGSTSTALAQA
jgi:hypothetical protein